jgi:hypothetical protein
MKGEVLSTAALTIEQLPKFIVPAEHMVVEEPLLIWRGKLQEELLDVVRWCQYELSTAYRAVPSEWKPTPYGRTTWVGPNVSQHERDAVRMGLWYMNEKLKTVSQRSIVWA